MNTMTWAPVWEAVLQQLVVPVATALLLALGGYVVSLLPGPIRSALSSATHKRDMELLLGAMMRAALSGKAPGDVVAYARENLPEVIAKLAPKPETLQTMAAAIVQEAAAKLAPVKVDVTGLEGRGA